jgi:ABC-type uncharacterized transport system permease subunit
VTSPTVAFEAAVDQHEPMARPVLDAQRAILAIVGFIGGVFLTKAFGLAGFIALLLLLVLGVPLLAVISARRSAARSARDHHSPGAA